jgi:hypothetical protein
MKQRQELEQAVKELHDHIEQAERKDSEKQSLLVAGPGWQRETEGDDFLQPSDKAA